MGILNILRNQKRRLLIIICLYALAFSVLTYFNPHQWRGYLALFLLTMAGTIIAGATETKKVTHQYQALDDSIIIANETLPYFRRGLNEETALVIVKIIQSITDAPAVAITDRENILAFIGVGCEKHPVGYPIRTQATIDAIQSGELKCIEEKKDFNCRIKNCDCPLESAIIVPLFNKNEVIGSIKFYNTEKGKISEEMIKIARGIGKLLSMQIELAHLDRQAQLVTEAKLDALQAQINPHFLFNSLNTINMYINKEPEYARKLMVRLSTLLRYMLGNYGRFITLGEELSYIEDYAVIENARFSDKLKFEFDIDDCVREVQIPVFTMQPMVQNAITHGVLPCGHSATVRISAHQDGNDLLIKVEDNGVGIREEDLEKVFRPGFGKGCGVGIPNVHERLKILYGDDYGLKIASKYQAGTKVSIRIPLGSNNGE